MTGHHPQPAGPPPTARQQRYLRQLAIQRGVSFVPPRTCSGASRLISRLKRRAPDAVADRRREIRAVRDDIARRRGDSARVIEGVETTGYGSGDLALSERISTSRQRLHSELLVVHSMRPLTVADEFEGDPRRRPLTVDELDAFFAACDDRVTRASASGPKGTLQAWRDQAMFKIAFGWGLRRQELAMLDMCDFRPDARLPEFGGHAQVHVRHGKSKRGGPQRRTVLTVFAWAVEVVEQYVAEIRPCFGAPRHPAMFLTERGTRIAFAYINERFAEIRPRRAWRSC
jgi:integrase